MRAPESRRLLARVVAEVRAQRPPLPSQPGVPPRLLAELRSGAAARAQSMRDGRRSVDGARTAGASARWLPRLALAAVLGGGAAFVIERVEGPGAGSRQLVPEAPLTALDGQALEVGALVLASDRPRLIEHAGRASWVLAPQSAARWLSASGGVLRVSLERGSLDARVQPSQQPASFIVQAQGTEVAVHGTQFRVSLLGELTRVAVAEGLVRVRPLGQVGGTLLGPGTQADFAAGVARPAPAPAQGGGPIAPRPPEAVPGAAPPSGRSTRPTAPTASSPSPPHEQASRTSTAPSAAPAAPPGGSAAPLPAFTELALQTVTEHVQSCFRRNLPGSSELGIEASTQLSLWVEPNGVLLRADFEPPLAPAVEACVAAQLAQLKVAPSAEGYRVERQIRLRR